MSDDDINKIPLSEEDYIEGIKKLKKSELLEKFLALREFRCMEIEAHKQKIEGQKEQIKNLLKSINLLKSNTDLDNSFDLMPGDKVYVFADKKNYSGSLSKETKDHIVLAVGTDKLPYKYVVRKDQIIGMKVSNNSDGVKEE